MSHNVRFLNTAVNSGINNTKSSAVSTCLYRLLSGTPNRVTAKPDCNKPVVWSTMPVASSAVNGTIAFLPLPSSDTAAKATPTINASSFTLLIVVVPLMSSSIALMPALSLAKPSNTTRSARVLTARFAQPMPGRCFRILRGVAMPKS